MILIFSEIYSAYYNAVAAILKVALERNVSEDEMRGIAKEYAFEESFITIVDSLKTEKWQLICENGETAIKKAPSIPLTNLQKSWLKAIGQDPRIKLFTDETFDFPDVEPLYNQEDIKVFDKYGDGDDFCDEEYIRNFRLILDAIRNEYPLLIEQISPKKGVTSSICLPYRLEYSEKDDKFRVFCKGNRIVKAINLGRITKVERCDHELDLREGRKYERARIVIFELEDRRNALERALMHFAHFKKQVERLEENRYRIKVFYDKSDETELVIRVLSFGPMIKVTEPSGFVNLIKERLLRQKSCGL